MLTLLFQETLILTKLCEVFIKVERGTVCDDLFVFIFDAGKLVDDERMEKGVVAGRVYLAYWNAVGKILAPAIVLFVALMTGK